MAQIITDRYRFHPSLSLSLLHSTLFFTLMEALGARSSVLSSPGTAGDASPSLSLPLRRASAAFPGLRRSPSALAISTRWLRAPPRIGGRLLAGAGEDGSLDPADDTTDQAGDFQLLEVLADVMICCWRSNPCDPVPDVLYFSCTDLCDSSTAMIIRSFHQ